MRISELADATGVPVATIKYYLREGLLPAGRKVSERLSEYDESHVRRLHLLRILRVVGDVPVERLLAVVESPDATATVHDMLAVAADVIAPTPPASADRAGFRGIADNLIDQAGWSGVRPDAKDRDNLASVLEAIFSLGTHPPNPDQARPYLELIDQLARFEVGNLDAEQDRQGILEGMIVGQVVFGQLVTVLRRLAHEHYSAARFGAAD